jgi:HSP20 family protein
MRDKVQHKSIFFLSFAHQFEEALWMPHIDVYRRSRSWLIKCDLAGVRLEDIAISTQGQTLSLCGLRRDPEAEGGWEHYSMEIPYGRFERSITLPEGLETARIVTHYQDGMLLIRVRFNGEGR